MTNNLKCTNVAKLQHEKAGGIRNRTILLQGRGTSHSAIEDLTVNIKKLRLIIAPSGYTSTES